MSNVLDKLSSVVEASQAVNVIAIVQEGLTSNELMKHARNFDFIKQQILTNSEMYSNLREPFDTVAFASSFNGSSTYTLQNMEELTTLTEAVQDKLKLSHAQPKVIEVIVKQTVHTQNLDKIAEQL